MSLRTIVRPLVSAGVLGFLLGCNAIVGIEQPSDRTAPRTPVGDSGVGDAGTTSVGGAFLGTWQSTGGATDTVNCPQGMQSVMTTVGFRVAAGTSSDLTATDPTSGRTFDFNVSGNTATLVVPDSFTTTPSTSETDAYTLTMGSFTLDSGGITATWSLAGTVTVSSPTAQGTCDVSEFATCTKTSN